MFITEKLQRKAGEMDMQDKMENTVAIEVLL